LVLSLTGIAEKNPTSAKSMFESLKVIVEAFDLCNAWLLFRGRNQQTIQIGVPDSLLPEGLASDANTPFTPGERVRIRSLEGHHWITFSLMDGGMLIFDKQQPYLMGEHVEDFANYLIVYFNGMIEWNHREESDKEVKESHHLLHQIVNAIPEMLAFKDLSGRYLVANQQADRSFLHRFSTIVGKTVEDLYPASEIEFIRQLDKEAIDNDEPIRREIQMMTETGYIEAETVRVPVKNEIGIPIGVISMSRDISDKKRTEAELKRFVAFQDTLMKIATYFINVPESKADEAIDMALAMAGSHIDADRVYVFDYHLDQGIMDNTYEWCREGISPEIDNLKGVPTADFMDNWILAHAKGDSVYLYDVFGLDPSHPLYQVLTPQGIQSILTIPLIHQDRLLGFVGFDAVRHKRHWTDQDQSLLKVLAGLIVNLKIRKEKEAELTLMRQKAEKANEAKSEFLANMSHEIRTPLSGIYNALYLLYNTPLSFEQQEYIDIANSSIESLSGIVNNILDLAKIESGKIELNFASFDLEDELYRVAKMEEYSALEKGLYLLIDMDFKIPRGVVHDRLRLRQILLNLVHNAVKFTEKGSITLKTMLESIENNQAAIRFEVIDTGIGISSHLLPIITEKFVQGDSSGTKKHAGTGLGLAIVKYLVEQFGGTLSIQSELGKGSVFSFTIGFDVDRNYPQHRFDDLHGKTVLLVDPIAEYVDHPRRFFESMGMDVQICDSKAPVIPPSVALTIFQSSFRDFDPGCIAMLGTSASLKSSIKALITVEPVTTLDGSLKEKGLDLLLTMPTTRQNVYQALTSKTMPKGIVEAPMPDVWEDGSAFSGIRVLVVDDNRINRQALELILRRSGFLVTLAQNGYEALDLARKLDFDLILMDIQMPGIDGYETTIQLRKLDHPNAKAPIVAVTANAQTSAKERAIEVGMNEAITKPIKPDQIFQLVEGYMNSHQIHRRNLPTIHLPITLPVFHWADFAKRFEGMFDLGKQIVTAFQEDMAGDLKKIQDAVAGQDFEAIRKAVHYFKGSASYCSADRVVWVCQQMLERAKNESFDSIELLANLLETESNEWKMEAMRLDQTGVFQ
jgi:PAS domain S-box-containing protein